jgi:hypothetical protein
MAQADYVPSSVRALITGTDAKASTDPVRPAYAELAGLEGDLPRASCQDIPARRDLGQVDALPDVDFRAGTLESAPEAAARRPA